MSVRACVRHGEGLTAYHTCGFHLVEFEVGEMVRRAWTTVVASGVVGRASKSTDSGDLCRGGFHSRSAARLTVLVEVGHNAKIGLSVMALEPDKGNLYRGHQESVFFFWRLNEIE